jgi:type I restriction enzyme S subunit
MAGDFKEYEVEELIRDGVLLINDGYRAKNSELSQTGIPFARAGNIDGGFDFSEADRVPPETLARAGLKRSQTGDVVFTSKGTVGRFAFVGDSTPEFVYSPQLCYWRSGDASRIHPRWLFYWMNGREFFLQFKGVAGQTDMAEYVSLRDQRAMKITLPPLAEQKAIAAVLGALDDKIELNRRMNATLEAMARALFSNWIQSHDDEIGEHLVQDLIDEKVLIIGDGYRAKNSEFADDGLPFIRAGNLRGEGFDLAGADVLSASSVKAAGHKVGMVGDVAFTSKGTVGRITRVSSKTGSFVYSPQVCFWRSTAPDKLHPNVLYRWMSTDDFTHQVATVSTQTDMAPYVSLQDQRKMVIQLPPPSAQREIATQLEAIDEKIATNAEQSRTLATLRDTLLPKLLSGEVSVKRLGA